jgi:tetratricopeptide (TPR) repeat protein/predicted Ser/Thr protein kinase
MPELSPQDILVGRIALSQGKISRPQLDLAIAAFNRGEAPSLPHALLRVGVLSQNDIKALIDVARRNEASSLTASVVKRAGSAEPLTASVFTRRPNGQPSTGSDRGKLTSGVSPPSSPYPPLTAPRQQPPVSGIQQSQASMLRPQPAAPNPLAPMPGGFDGMQTVRVQAAPAQGSAAPLPPIGGSAHEFMRRQYEEFVLGRLVVARGLLTDAQVQEIGRRQKLEDTSSGKHTPLARVLMRSGAVPPAVVDRMCEEIKRKVFACGRCGDCFYLDPGAQPQRLACRRCQGPVDVPSEDGRTLAPDVTTTQGSNESTKADADHAPVDPTAPPVFGSSPAPAPSAGGGASSAAAGNPEMIAEWVVEREIGRGGMGVIYLAKHRTTGARAALKVMLNASSASEKKQRRFNREMDACRKLDHPNIVKLLDEGEHEGYPYFAMEFVEGKPLDKLLKEELDLEQCMEILEKLCRGVHAAHEAGIIHRDIKPANILVTEELEPKLTDFGLAKSDDHKSVLTKTGAVVGTPYYLSPEQARGDSKDVDRRADIYALGVIMYELLTGRLPFVGQTTVELYNRILNDEPPPPTKVKPQLTREIELVCLKSLEKDPRDRYKNAEQMADDVRALLEARPKDVKARRPSRLKKLFRRLKKKGLGVVLAFVFGIATVLLGAGGFALWWKHAQDKREAAARDEQKTIKGSLDLALKTGAEAIAVCDSRLGIPGSTRDLLKAENEAVASVEKSEELIAKPTVEENRSWIEQFRSTRSPELKRAHALLLVARARTWMASDDPSGLEKASADVDAALKCDGDNPEAIVAQSECGVLSGKPEKIREALEGLDQHATGWFPARLAKARILRVVVDDATEALKSCDDAQALLGADEKSAKPGALKESWTVSRARLLCEQALSTLNSDPEEGPPKTLDFAQEAVKVAPDLWETHAVLARALAANGRRRDARLEANRARDLSVNAKTNTPRLEALLAHGEILLQLRRPDLARPDADRAVELSPDSLDALVLRAEIEEAQLDEKSARTDAEQVIARRATSLKQWPAAVRAYRLLARLLVMTNDPNDVARALTVVRSAVELDGETMATRLLSFRIQLHPKYADANADPVEKALMDAKKKHGTSIETKRVLALIAQVRGGEKNLAKAKDRVQSAVKADPAGAWGHALLARVYRAGTAAESAEADAEAARALELERDPTRDEGWFFALGLRAFGRQGSREAATSALRHATFADPLHAQALVALGEATWQTETQRSMDLLDKAAGATHLFPAAHETNARRRARWSSSDPDSYKRAQDEIAIAEKLAGCPRADFLSLDAYLQGRSLLVQVLTDREHSLVTARKDEFLAKVQAISAVTSQSLVLDPYRVATTADALETLKQLESVLERLQLEVPAEIKTLAARMTRTRAILTEGVNQRTDAARRLTEQAQKALQGNRLEDALDAARRATRAARWLPEAWLALAQGRARSNDPAGALAAFARAASLDEANDPRSFASLARIAPPAIDPAHALAQLAGGVRAAMLAQKPLGDLESALTRDDDASPVSDDERLLVTTVLYATSALVAPDAPSSADARKRASEAGRELLRRRPEELQCVFASGLAAIAANDGDSAGRDLGFCALARDEKGELLYLAALARARAAQAASDATQKLVRRGDALDSLEEAIALDPALADEAARDKDLGALVQELRKK